MGKIVGAVVALVLIVFGIGALFTNTTINTAPNEQGLWYKAGPLTSTHFDDCIAPGTRKLTGGLSDQTFVYPAGQRNFEFSDSGSGEAGTIVALTKDNVELRTSGVVRFELTRDCETLTKFHEEIGLSNKAYFRGGESEGWLPMLNKYLHASLQRAVNEATQEFDWKELYNNVEVKAAWEKKVSELLPRFVQQSMDGEYFENYSLTIQKPTLPDDLLKALQDTQTAMEQNNAQKERNTTVETEAQSIKRLVDILGPEGYNTYQAIKDGKITIYPIPQGSGVIVNGAPTEPTQ
ncbi:MAG: hypothetical protein H9W81_02470 [Enterococcus sp.]|nr:hypothetical protein [Enterococcus sp.]